MEVSKLLPPDKLSSPATGIAALETAAGLREIPKPDDDQLLKTYRLHWKHCGSNRNTPGTYPCPMRLLP
jgi:hypothetical protein